MAGYRAYTLNTIDRGNGGGGACAYYRMILPFQTMERLGLPIETVVDRGNGQWTPEMSIGLFLESDFSLVYQQLGAATPKMMKAAKDFKAMRNGVGEVQWPPTFIADTDDDIFNVAPLNQSYENLGTKRHDGVLAEDGDEIGVADPSKFATPEQEAILNDKYPASLAGTRGDIEAVRFVYGADARWHEYVMLWKDGVNIDFARNRARMENWRETMKLANLITCSTPRAENYVKRELGEDANTFVAYNAIDFDAYPKVELADHPGTVRILWEGSACHQEGLWPLNASLARLSRKYPQTEWVFFGAPYDWALKNIPAGQLTHIPWVVYEAYKTRLSCINHDISMAPLASNTFNQSRSAIRWYENSAIWRPAATVAQNVGPFYDEIIEGETGLLFNNPQEFEEKMSMLIEDAQLRQTLAANSKDWIRAHREAKDIATKLFMKWVEVREGQKRTIPIDDRPQLEVNIEG